MSFHVQFLAANAKWATHELDTSYPHLPACVRDFLDQALAAHPTGPVVVKAIGHLFDGGNGPVSSADIEVSGLKMIGVAPDPTSEMPSTPPSEAA